MFRHQLKCKIGALAAEARFTRNCERREIREARRIDKKFREADPIELDQSSSVKRRERSLNMRLHRIGSVRSSARWSQLAYAFLRGKPYLLVERSRKKNAEGKTINRVDWEAVEKLARRFSGLDFRVMKKPFADWREAKLSNVQIDRLASIDNLAKEKLNYRRAVALEKRQIADVEAMKK